MGGEEGDTATAPEMTARGHGKEGEVEVLEGIQWGGLKDRTERDIFEALSRD